MSLGYTGLGPARSQDGPKVLATAQGAGTSTYIGWNRSEGMIEVSGTFDGATVTLNARHKDRPSIIIPVKDMITGTAISTSTASMFYTRLPSAYEVSITVTGGSSPSINAYIN